METEQSLAIMKALADRSRLAIVNSLLERPQYAEEIARRHDLAPSTVSFHLRKLEQAGLVTSRKEQYYLVIQANRQIFDTTLREIVLTADPGKELQDQRMEEYRSKVLESFFRHGVLERLPTQHKKRLIVLERFALRFAPQQRYSEQEVTSLIAPLFEDYCTVRRLLVDEGLVKREGSVYWREAPAGEEQAGEARAGEKAQTGDEARVDEKAPQRVLPAASVEPKGVKVSEKKESRRAELKRLYKQNVPEMGVYQIKNGKNGRIYLGTSTNLDSTRTSRLFQLRMGKVVFSPELQKDLDRFGAESFEFSVLGVLEKPEPGENVDRLLAALQLHWMEKLKPFGERGYNSEKAVERLREALNL